MKLKSLDILPAEENTKEAEGDGEHDEPGDEDASHDSDNGFLEV